MPPTAFRCFAAFLFTLLLAGCGGGGGGDSSRNVVEDPPAAPKDGLSGTVQSRISGANITVTDANGQDVTVASGGTTSSSGRFDLVFSEFSIDAGINAPLIVTINAGGATAICDFDGESDSDCQNADGTFVAFGETYTLASDFVLRGIVPTFPPASTAGERRVQVNISATSDLAASLAENSGAATLTASIVNKAAARALGVTEFITGLPTRGRPLNEIAIPDLTQASAPDSSSMAVALFAASQHSKVDATRPARSTYRRILNDIANNLSIDSTTDLVKFPAPWLIEAIGAYVTTAAAYQGSLATPSPVLAGAIASQAGTLDLLENTPPAPVQIAEPASPESDEPLEQSRLLVNRLTEAIGATLLVSTADAFGGTAAGAATVYSDQLSLIETVASIEVRNAMILLDEALRQALIDGETQLTGTNVSGVLTFDGDTVNVTTATATTSNIQTGTSVNISIQNGERANPGGPGDFIIDEITIGVTRAENNATSQQLYEGEATFGMTAGTETAEVSEVNFNGEVRARSGLEFLGEIHVAALSAVNAATTTGNFEATFIFVDQSSLGMTGTLQSGIQAYRVNTLSSSIVVDLVTNVITDFIARLNLATDVTGTEVTRGTLTSGGVEAGTMTAEGNIDFSDGTSVILPAPII